MRHINLSLSSIVKSVLNEDMVKTPKEYGIDISGKIDKAIDTRHYLYLYYDDGKGDKYTKIDPTTGQPRWGNPRAYRVVLPFAHYESNQNGEDTLRALHWNSMHTKRGPGKWKEFKLSHIKGARLLKNTFTDEDIPDNANWNGDKHASKMYNIVKRGEEPDKDYEYKFMSPLEREKERFRREKKGISTDDLYTNQQNQQGAIDTTKSSVPQVKKGRNLKTMQNLGKPGNIDYKKAYDALKQSNARNTFRDWDAAEAERRDQQVQQQRPMNPPQNNPGPVNTNNNEEDWDEYLNRPNNNNF